MQRLTCIQRQKVSLVGIFYTVPMMFKRNVQKIVLVFKKIILFCFSYKISVKDNSVGTYLPTLENMIKFKLINEVLYLISTFRRFLNIL